MNLIRAVSLFVFLFVSTANATYVYEANQSLFNLVTEQNTTNLGAGDDAVSSAFNLDFTFTFYGQDFTSARMATNGCLHFGSSGSYCNDYTPDPLPEITYTLYPFWTDLIRDGNSSVLAKNFSDKTVFGWYNLREYNRSGSDNSFEVILWNSNDSFEFRYGGLDIINHDVLIGEQGSSSELYTYLYHDECSVGTTNVSGTCVNTNWNSTSFNTLLEDGGSLYGVGSGNALDCSNPLNNTACSGYAAAYLTQQCSLDGLYSTQCPTYWDDLFDYECTQNPQSSMSCSGYVAETYAYDTSYEDNYDYGYTEDDMWYDEEFDEYLYPDDPCYENACADFTDADWYELDIEQFGQEQVDEWYGAEIEFSEEGFLDFSEMDTTEEEFFTVVDEGMDEYDIQQEAIWVAEELAWQEEQRIYEEEIYEETYEETYLEEVYEETYEEVYLFEPETEQEYDVLTLEEDLLFNFEHEQLVEVFEEVPTEFLEFETIQELEEWFEDEQEEELVEEEMDQDRDMEDRESLAEEREEDSEISLVEEEDDKKEKQLNVVANTIRAASNSVGGTTSGTSIQSTGNSVASGGVANTTSTAVASSASGGGISTSNSPSISAQVASSAIQTQQVLSMNTGSVGVGSSSISVDTSSTFGTSGSMDTSSLSAGADNTAVGNTAGSQNTAVGNTSGDNNTAIGNDTTAASETSTNTEVASNTSGDNNTAIGNTSGDNNTAVGNTAGSQNTAVGSMETEIATAMGEVSASEADQIADQIVAQNIEDQQEQLEEQQQETGEYGDESQLIAYMGFVQGFDDYSQVIIADAVDWYEPEAIYANVSIPDNNSAFIGLYGDSLTGMKNLMSGQPNL